jgi:SAM-dependent methyltransferase
LRSGQEIVVLPERHDPAIVSLVDLAQDGLPVHVDRVRADCVARARRMARDATGLIGAPASGGAGNADPRNVVADGYNQMAERYAAWAAGSVVDDARPRYLAALLERLPPGARVLELGCGGGGPTTQHLAARFALTGVDISARQIELARVNVPSAELIRADMTQVALPAESFDAVVSFYAFGHLPYGDLPMLLRKIGTWLRPNGVLVATMSGADPGTIEPNWLGVPMYFSGYEPSDTRRFIEEARLEIESFREEAILEDGRPTGFLWVIARKVGASASASGGEG